MGLDRELALGLCYLRPPLEQAGYDTQYLDLAHELARIDLALYEQLIRIGFAEYADGVYDLCVPLILETVSEGSFSEHAALGDALRRWARRAAPTLGQFDVHLLTLMNGNVVTAVALGRELRRLGARVVVGGPAVRPRAVGLLLLHLGACDVVVVGEGEERVVGAVEVARGLRSIHALPGAMGWHNGELVETGPPPPQDLDTLAWPSFRGAPTPQKIPVMASRGCTFACSFCSERFVWGAFRCRNPAQVALEVAHHKTELGAVEFTFRDDLLNSRADWFLALARALASAAPGIRWDSYMVPYGWTPELVDAAHTSGCRFAKIGIQTFSPRLLKEMHRPPSVLAIVEGIGALLERGIGVAADIIVGHPGETAEDHRLTMEGVERLAALPGKLSIDVHNFALFYGTGVHKKLEKYGASVRYMDGESLSRELRHLAPVVSQFIAEYRQTPDRATVWQRRAELEDIVQRTGRGRNRPSGASSALAQGLSTPERRVARPAGEIAVELGNPGTPQRALAEAAVRQAEGAAVRLVAGGHPDHAAPLARLARGLGAKTVAVELHPAAATAERVAFLAGMGVQRLVVVADLAAPEPVRAAIRLALEHGLDAGLRLDLSPASPLAAWPAWMLWLPGAVSTVELDASRQEAADVGEAPEGRASHLVSWQELAAWAEGAQEAGLRAGLRVVLGAFRAAPMCRRPRGAAAEALIPGGALAGPRVFAPECAACALSAVCPGFSERYARAHPLSVTPESAWEGVAT
jgi:radical SAM superfamily enzyme YgiQ (UPF0313 family)